MVLSHKYSGIEGVATGKAHKSMYLVFNLDNGYMAAYVAVKLLICMHILCMEGMWKGAKTWDNESSGRSLCKCFYLLELMTGQSQAQP